MNEDFGFAGLIQFQLARHGSLIIEFQTAITTLMRARAYLGRFRSQFEAVAKHNKNIPTPASLGFDQVEIRFDSVIGGLNLLKVSSLSTVSHLHNVALENPDQPHLPVAILGDDGTAKLPDNRFPKTPNDLFALRVPSDQPARDLVAYLADFYKIDLDDRDELATSSSENDEPPPAVIGPPELHPGLVVDRLEQILYYDKSKFIRFQ